MSEDNNSQAMAEPQDNEQSNSFGESGSESHENGSDENRSSSGANDSSLTAPSGGQDTPNQPRSRETFQNYKEARQEHDNEWWGKKHPEPPLGHPDRQFMFSHNETISEEELDNAIKRYNDSIANPETGELEQLGVQVRSSTPPLERVEKQIQSLEAGGQQVSTELAMEMYNNFTSNSGFATTLLEWSGGEDLIPIEHANELFKEKDRLKLEMAMEQRDLHRMLDESNKDIDRLREFNIKQGELITLRNSEVASLKKELQSKKNAVSGSINESVEKDHRYREAIGALENELRVVKEDNDRLNDRNRLDSQRAESEHSTELKALQHQLEASQTNYRTLQGELEESQRGFQTRQDQLEGSRRDCQALQSQLERSQRNHETLQEEHEVEQKRREEAEREVAKYMHFHQEIYKQLQIHAKTWALTKASVDSLATDDASTTQQAREMIREASKHLGQLKKSYEVEWPRMKTLAGKERLVKDRIILGALKDSEEEQRASLERNFQLRNRRRQDQNEGEAEKVRLGRAQPAPSSGDSPQESRDIKDLKDQLQELRKNSSAFSTMISEKDREIGSLADELRTCKEELKAYKGAERVNRDPAESPNDEEEAVCLQRHIDRLEDDIETLRQQNRTLESQATISQDNATAAAKPTFIRADDLVQAVRVRDGNSNVADLGLIDRINYLNLACFIRTRNYVQFALREGANRLANILIQDAHDWVEFCRDDFQNMSPIVSGQIDSSVRILHGLGRILTATNQQELDKGRRNIEFGRRDLRKFGDSVVFGQLGLLADSIIDATRTENDNPSYRRKFRFDQYSGYWPKKRIDPAKMQKVIKRGPNMRANAMRTGLHAPLSPEKWSKDGPNAGIDTPETSV
ncbi:hypothetical protein FHETE_7532 [Fusarium heterosporum]|uniref:Uncharacterized protein n=1 Tax=Fusarium heterosporum TaxID=42747 RepID=A0A8H5WHY4_FUSHE|nr:hypothetical protein FHETE_7532 [Fusarium heterosporum]